jgi:hypothetical protein
MGNPKQGMYYDDVKKRVKRITKTAPSSESKDRLVNSLLNQTKIHDGEGAVAELKREMIDTNYGSGYSGKYLRSHGIGEFKKGSGGHYIYDEKIKKWVKEVQHVV